jgi:MFS family permease
MTQMTEQTVLRRFLVLAALRWVSVGFLIPIFVLLPLDRGLTLAQIGLAASMQGWLVFALELPTGGVADSIGRRPVQAVAVVIGMASMVVLLVADSLALFAVVFALQGVFRALDSGPLDAWYVDAAQAADPAARIDRGMSLYGTVVSLAIAAGSIGSGALIAWDPADGMDALTLPVAVSLAVQALSLVAVLVLMTEAPRHEGPGLMASVRETPRTILSGLRLLRGSHALLALVALEVLWGLGVITYETLLPVRLAEVTSGPEAAAAITGPAATAAWVFAAGGSAMMPWLGRRIGLGNAGVLSRVLLGVTVVLMGVFGGLVGVLAVYLLCYGTHGIMGAAHSTLLHRNATSDVRATVVSLNSWGAQPAAALGLIGLTALADGVSVSVAMYAGGAVLALAAPLFWVAARPAPVDDAVDPQGLRESSVTA